MIKILATLILTLLITACAVAAEEIETETIIDDPIIIEQIISEPIPLEHVAEEVSEEPIVPPDPIEELISQMSIEEKIGQLFIARMPSVSYAEDLIANHHIGGFILFSGDVSSIEQVQRLTTRLQEASNIPLFIAVDEEGGRVSRVGRLFPERSGSAFSIGQTGDPQNAYDAYFEIGNKLSYLGFNMNFAPVADVWSNPANTVIGDRSFGTEPELVAEMVVAAVNGLQSAGIIAVIKHFPGHGDTLEDSHYNMAFFNHDRERFDAVEAIPFIAGIEAGVEGVMMGHITTPRMGEAISNLPATFSYYFMEHMLRYEMGFDGLIITDALDMGALTRYHSPENILLHSFNNGADILLMPSDPSWAIEFMVQAFEDGWFTEERLHRSLRRILEYKM